MSKTADAIENFIGGLMVKAFGWGCLTGIVIGVVLTILTALIIHWIR